MTSYHCKSIPGSIYLKIDSRATTTGQDRRSPNLPISLSEATITEGQLPLGILSPLQLRILGNHPRPMRTSLIASAREPADIGVVAHISSREGWLIQKGTYLYLAGLEKQEKLTAEMVDYFPLTPFFLIFHRDEWDEGRTACPTSRPE